MDNSELSPPEQPSPNFVPSPNYAFAFNDVNFSDRILRIEILPELTGSKPDPDHCMSDPARKRKRSHNGSLVNTDNNGHVAAQGDETSSSMDCSTVVKTIHISSPILAAKSPFFYKLFSNGMRESEQRHVTLRIQASEEAALMDLLNFIYSNTVPRTTQADLLDVLMAADKYEVASCMTYCSQLLQNLPMTCESALLYLDLPSTVQMSDTVLPLIDAAKKFLVEIFKDLNKHQEEVLKLPLVGIEVILFSDDLKVGSEDDVYDFALKWASTHYPKLEERRQILSTRLLRFIRFPLMTCRKLKEILNCPDFDPEIASKVVLDALCFYTEAPSKQRSLVATKDAYASFRCYVERAYIYKPVKVMEFESPYQHCIVCLDLKREEVANLSQTGCVYSHMFFLGGQGFFLSVQCNLDQQSSFQCFGLYLHIWEKGSVSVDYKFGLRMKPTENFVSKCRGNYTFTGEGSVGPRKLFGVPWTAFIADDSCYFINGVLHLRGDLTIKK